MVNKMTIEEIIELWKNSKYEYLFIQDIPVVRDDKEVVRPAALLSRKDKYCLGGEMTVFEYLIKVKNNKSLFYFKEIKDDNTLVFIKIINVFLMLVRCLTVKI